MLGPMLFALLACAPATGTATPAEHDSVDGGEPERAGPSSTSYPRTPGSPTPVMPGSRWPTSQTPCRIFRQAARHHPRHLPLRGRKVVRLPGVRVTPGESVDVARIVDERAAHTSFAAGIGAGLGGAVVPNAALLLSFWHSPADVAGWRLSAGGLASIGLGPTGDLGTWPAGTVLARGALLYGGRLAVGPMAGAGVLWRIPNVTSQAAPLGNLGVHAHADFGAFRFTLEPGVGVLAVDSALTALPRAGLTLGFNL